MWPGQRAITKFLASSKRRRCITVGGEKLPSAERLGHAGGFVRSKRKFASSTCRPRRAQRAPSRLVGRLAYLSEGKSASALAPPRRPYAQRAQGDPRALLLWHACTRDRSDTRTCFKSAQSAQQSDGCQTFVSQKHSSSHATLVASSSKRCEGCLPFLTHPTHIMELASAVQSRHLYPESPGWNSAVQRLFAWNRHWERFAVTLLPDTDRNGARRSVLRLPRDEPASDPDGLRLPGRHGARAHRMPRPSCGIARGTRKHRRMVGVSHVQAGVYGSDGKRACGRVVDAHARPACRER